MVAQLLYWSWGLDKELTGTLPHWLRYIEAHAHSHEFALSIIPSRAPSSDMSPSFLLFFEGECVYFFGPHASVSPPPHALTNHHAKAR